MLLNIFADYKELIICYGCYDEDDHRWGVWHPETPEQHVLRVHSDDVQTMKDAIGISMDCAKRVFIYRRIAWFSENVKHN